MHINENIFSSSFVQDCSYNALTNQPGFPVAFESSGCRGPAGELTPVRAASTKVECRRHKLLGRPEKVFKIGPSKMKLPEFIIIHYHTQTQRKIKFKPRKKLNHNLCITSEEE